MVKSNNFLIPIDVTDLPFKKSVGFNVLFHDGMPKFAYVEFNTDDFCHNLHITVECENP